MATKGTDAMSVCAKLFAGTSESDWYAYAEGREERIREVTGVEPPTGVGHALWCRGLLTADQAEWLDWGYDRQLWLCAGSTEEEICEMARSGHRVPLAPCVQGEVRELVEVWDDA